MNTWKSLKDSPQLVKRKIFSKSGTARPFRLLDLPPEIWIKICKLAVTHDGAILINPMELGHPTHHAWHQFYWNDTFYFMWRRYKDHHQPAITRAALTPMMSEQILKSGCPDYKANVFFADLSGSTSLQLVTLTRTHLGSCSWLWGIGEANLGYVEHLYVKYGAFRRPTDLWKMQVGGLGLTHRPATVDDVKDVKRLFRSGIFIADFEVLFRLEQKR